MTLIQELKKFYKKDRRDLPWRKTHDPYKILVSEVMLQQTQVDRVKPKYAAFLREFPTAKALAKAPLSKVLAQWQGLGYNRRAKYLHEAAKIIATSGWQEKLPGVGPYTRQAVETFAFNKPGVFIETNIRTVYLHYYHSSILQKARMVSDKELLPLIERDLKKSKMEPRDFYAALMDYGSYLKRSGVKINKHSKHYIKQSKFKGSDREVRGAILRELLKKPMTLNNLCQFLAHAKICPSKEKAPRLLAKLVAEGLLTKKGARYSVAD